MDSIDYGKHIQIDVETEFLEEQSDAQAHRFVFSYHITITNHNAEPVQLLSRFWKVTDGNEQVQEIQGEGVVGEQPQIEANDSFSYTSGTVLATEVGSMQGYYEMQTESEERFIATIEPFTLAQPNALH